MDPLDVAILRHLYGPTDGPTGIPTAWTVARRLGAHGATVKRRLTRLRSDGILRAVRVAPTAALLGATAHLVEFQFEDARAKTAGLPVLGSSPNVVEIHDLVGEHLSAWVYAFDGASPARTIQSLKREAGADATTILHEWAAKPERGLDTLDARILHALAPDAHRAMRDLTKETRVTPKTFRARLRALARARAFITYPSISFAQVRGATPYVLRAELSRAHHRAAHARLLAAFPDHVCASAPQGEHAFLYLVAPTTADVGRALDLACGIDGVRRAHVRLARDLRSFPEKIRSRLAQRMEPRSSEAKSRSSSTR